MSGIERASEPAPGAALGTMTKICEAGRCFTLRAPWLAALALLGLLAFSPPAAADVSPEAPAVSAVANAAPPANADGAASAGDAQNSTPMTQPVVTPRSKRWLYTALLVSGFLIFAGVVGANDKLRGDAKPLNPQG